MAGVSGIGGRGGPSNIPSPDSDDDKRSESSKFGGHDIVYGSESGEHGPSSIEERANMLMKSGFQVHNPEEVEARSSVSQKGGQKSGFFGRMWDAVKGIFEKKTSKESVTMISSPEIPGYKKYGKRLPEARAVHTHFQSQGEGLGIDSGDTGVADVEGDAVVGDLVDIEHSSDAESSSKTSKNHGLARRVRGWWDYTTKQQETPVDGRVGLSLSELQDIVERFTKMMDETDNESERTLFAQYVNTYRGYIQDMVSAGAELPSDRYNLLDGSFDETASAKHVDQLGESILVGNYQDLSRTPEEDLVSMIDTGHDADSVLGELSPEVRRVLDEAQSMRATFDAGISENVTPDLRERILGALDKLILGIRNLFIVIRNSLIGLSRLVRNGLRALGEFVRRRGTLKDSDYQLLIDEDDISPGVGELLTQYTDSSNADASENTFVIPRSVVEAWADGIPEVVYMTRVGDGFGEAAERLEDEGIYEEISAKDFMPKMQENSFYQTMRPRGIGDLPLEEDSVIYEDMSGLQDSPQEEFIYDTPRTSPLYEVPRGAPGLYDIPRSYSTPSESDENGYMIPNSARDGVFGVTPGFGHALSAVYSASYIDRLIEENDRIREGIWTTASSADFGLEEGRRRYAAENRPLPPLPPLETPPPSPYGNNRVMQLVRRLQSGMNNVWKGKRK
ncbi:hypothetical protein CP09DC79_0430 [Chlamydia psittaci 09DC79]|uniref:hypothetical protein n=1 Tax=Chlamydia psittaci TaxID=83554 RepID=UPI0003532A11|nr:hypothetical protein [Chlamydia psittaci]EPJ25283.1 hypothetical protein CP09DC77_0707 [Chlamydia psittaci 09DC77]EPJ26637.1 hypothetical protein CP09DC80_0708 [Chlamydia psittaci 09DC80]EPL01644.1 hypothetical protein CP09DC79_0430 [Chlamydia psittaci 09DC79]